MKCSDALLHYRALPAANARVFECESEALRLVREPTPRSSCATRASGRPWLRSPLSALRCNAPRDFDTRKNLRGADSHGISISGAAWSLPLRPPDAKLLACLRGTHGFDAFAVRSVLDGDDEPIRVVQLIRFAEAVVFVIRVVEVERAVPRRAEIACVRDLRGLIGIGSRRASQGYLAFAIGHFGLCCFAVGRERPGDR